MSREDMSCDWFHGALSREDAQKILIDESQKTMMDGIFLVRESLTLPNSYVLSVIYSNEFYHYQIQQHGEDAFFSIDSQCIQHGLDYLIEFYRKESSNLCTRLEKYVRKSLPPTNLCRSGKANLLHRATKADNLNVVKEILTSSYRSFDAKDELGMSAVHIAAIHGVQSEIMKLLIEKGAAVMSRDSKGNTPMHYACQKNCKEMVELLLNASLSLLHARNNETGLVPLHEAARAGHFEIVKLLLKHNTASMPRTIEGFLPSDLARDNKHLAIAEYLETYIPQINTFTHKWHHGTLGREGARTLLLQKRNELYEDYAKDESAYVNDNKEINELISGLFLVRSSERNKGLDVITMLHDEDEFKNIRNYVINKHNKFLYIDDGPYMHSLEHLISYYMTFADGLPVKLSRIVEPIPKPPVPIPKKPSKQRSFDSALTSKALMSPVDSPNRSPNRSASVADNIPNESSPSKQPKSSSSSIFDTIFRKKKSTSREEKSSDGASPSTAALTENFNKSLSFSSGFLNNNMPGESYDVPRKPPNADLVTYFTESDKNVWENSDMNDNCIEEIYFLDPPIDRGHKIEWEQLDPVLYDTQRNLQKELNFQTCANYYVSKDEIRMEREIGSGEFGNVLRGVLKLQNDKKLWVAVKTLHKEHYQDNLAEFLREASVMIKLDHPYIVKIIGITKGPPVGLVQELCPLGSLANYLNSHKDVIENIDITLWASQIAQGMEFLESKRFVHRDLASRNILLATKELAKISDFGLSRAVGVDQDFYQSKTGGRWPLKWYAPESFYGKFSHASDVWSFAIALWELYSKGQTPYGEMSGSEVNELIGKGHRLAKPECCPEDIYNLMLECWHPRDHKRPNFKFLAEFFTNQHLSHANANVPDENSSDNEHSNTVYV